MRYLLCLAFALIGCGANPTFTAPAVDNAVSMNAADWSLLYGADLPKHPTQDGQGWSFTFGQPHYVEVPYRATENLTGKTLTATFELVSSAAARDRQSPEENNEGFSMMTQPNLHLERLHDKLSNYLARIAAVLPDQYKLTLIARNTENEKAHIVIGDDQDIKAVVYLLEHPELMPIEIK